jgi:tetratricopeptide (TPR) repeat protein
MTPKNFLPAAMICLALVVGTILLYAPTTHFDFVNYDDQVYIINNPHINTGFHWSEFPWYFQAGYAGNWHPLTWMSHAIDCQLFGLSPAGPHVVNLFLHTANSLLVFLLLLELTGALWQAGMVAALFAWHPLHVESVAWIAERKDVLSALFFLLTLLAYARHARGGKMFYPAALALFALGLMAKPMLVSLPIILLLLDFWPLQRFGKIQEGCDIRRLGPLVMEKLPFFLLAIGSSVLTVVAQNREGLLAGLSSIPLKNRIVNAEMTYWRYLQKTVWPSDLGATYPYIFHASKPLLLVIGVFLVAVTWFALRVWQKRPFWAVGWVWFVVMLVPVIDLFHAGGQPMADRYMYLPSIGLFVLLCWEAADLAGPSSRAPVILGAVAAIALAACLTISSRQIQVWRNEETVLARIPEANVNFLAHANYAAYLMHHNQLPKAESEARAAILISPGNPTLPALLGEVQRREGKLDGAVKSLRGALAMNPGISEIHLPLGEILLQQGKPAEAAAEFELALQGLPNDPVAHWWRGNALIANKDVQGGLGEFAAALKLRPDYPEALNDAAWTLATTSISTLRNPARAILMAERACALSHNAQPRMLGTLAAAYAASARFEDAVATAQKAHDLALAQGDRNFAAQTLQLQSLYRNRKAFTENP